MKELKLSMKTMKEKREIIIARGGAIANKEKTMQVTICAIGMSKSRRKGLSM